MRTNFLQTNASNLSQSPGMVRWYLASGLIICGCPMMNVGFTQVSSKYSPTNLSSIRAFVCGGEQSILFSARILLRNAFVSSVCSWSPGGNFTPSSSSSVGIISILYHQVSNLCYCITVFEIEPSPRLLPVDIVYLSCLCCEFGFVAAGYVLHHARNHVLCEF